MADEMNIDELLIGLASMGFEFEDCQLALEAGNKTLESAVEWLMKRSNLSNNVAGQEGKLAATKENLVSQTQEPLISNQETAQPPINLSSRYTISEEHQKAKDQFMEKERENARMEAKRRKLMEKRARQEILQQIAEDKERRVGKLERKQTAPQSIQDAAQASTSAKTSNEHLPDRNQCLLQIRMPDGVLRREKFFSTTKLQDVLAFICKQNKLITSDYKLLQPFPHKVFSDGDMTCSLVDLGLTPSGSLVLKKEETSQLSMLSAHGSIESNNNCNSHSVQTINEEIDRPRHDQEGVLGTSSRSNNGDNDGSGNRGDEGNEMLAAPAFLNRSPPPELGGFLDMPVPNVLDIGGRHNIRARQLGHAWGGGVRLGAVEHNPHAIDPVPRAQTPGESALKRLEMRQQPEHQPEAGPSHLGHEDQPVLHRNVQRLEDLLINHVSHRLPGHQHPINSLGMMPHELCDKILNHLMKNKTLAPKVMQAFLSSGLRHVKFDCYPLVTNELLLALRPHRHLTHLSLKACPLITDKALEAVAVLKRLKALNLSQCAKLTDKCFFYIKGLENDSC